MDLRRVSLINLLVLTWLLKQSERIIQEVLDEEAEAVEALHRATSGQEPE